MRGKKKEMRERRAVGLNSQMQIWWSSRKRKERKKIRKEREDRRGRVEEKEEKENKRNDKGRRE
jgi:hypothetical protein